MKHALLLVALAGAGCSAWQFPEPTPRWPRPPVFGLNAWDGPPLRPAAYDAVASGPHVYVSILQSAGRDLDLKRVEGSTLTLVEVNAASGATRSLPPSMLEAKAVSLWPSAVTGLLVQQGTRVASFDGTSWSELPTLPTAAPLDLLWRVDAQSVVARQGTQLWVLTGGAWLPVTLTALSAVFGPVSAGAIRLVWTDGSAGLCTARVRLTDATMFDAPECLPGITQPLGGDVLNGTSDDFQAWSRGLVDVQLFHFTAAAGWSSGGAALAQSVRWTPDSADAVLSQPVPGSIPLQHLMRAVQGQLGEALFVQSWELFGCDGPLRDCAQNLGFVRELVSPDGAQRVLRAREPRRCPQVDLREVREPASPRRGQLHARLWHRAALRSRQRHRQPLRG